MVRWHFIFLALLMCTSSASAANITVCSSGCNYTIVQGAIDIASPGDTVLIVNQSTCNESFLVESKNNITVDCGGCTLLGNDSFLFNLSNSQNTTLEDCVLEESHYPILLENSSDTVFLNSTFNSSSFSFQDPNSNLTIYWYLTLDVTNFFGQTIPPVYTSINDSFNNWVHQGLLNGQIILAEESYSQGANTSYTPHEVTVGRGEVVNSTIVTVNRSQTVSMELALYVLAPILQQGWNLIAYFMDQFPCIETHPGTYYSTNFVGVIPILSANTLDINGSFTQTFRNNLSVQANITSIQISNTYDEVNCSITNELPLVLNAGEEFTAEAPYCSPLGHTTLDEYNIQTTIDYEELDVVPQNGTSQGIIHGEYSCP
ncbi:hypothetical protein ACFLRC_00855 [Candidatus Altiarchaeota archaeon]